MQFTLKLDSVPMRGESILSVHWHGGATFLVLESLEEIDAVTYYGANGIVPTPTEAFAFAHGLLQRLVDDRAYHEMDWRSIYEVME